MGRVPDGRQSARQGKSLSNAYQQRFRHDCIVHLLGTPKSLVRPVKWHLEYHNYHSFHPWHHLLAVSEHLGVAVSPICLWPAGFGRLTLKVRWRRIDWSVVGREERILRRRELLATIEWKTWVLLLHRTVLTMVLLMLLLRILVRLLLRLKVWREMGRKAEIVGLTIVSTLTCKVGRLLLILAHRGRRVTRMELGMAGRRIKGWQSIAW